MTFKTPYRLAAVLALLTAASCAHHKDVRPGADGINHVLVRATEKEHADRDAIAQAEDYCESLHKRFAIVDEKSAYTGTMDEDTRDTVRKASQAAIILGGTGAGVGRGGTRTAGTAVGAAGTVGAVMTNGKDYMTEMHFKCL